MKKTARKPTLKKKTKARPVAVRIPDSPDNHDRLMLRPGPIAMSDLDMAEWYRAVWAAWAVGQRLN